MLNEISLEVESERTVFAAFAHRFRALRVRLLLKQGADVKMNVEAAKTWSIPNPILRDTTGKVGKAYGATNTPNMFVIDKTGTVVYAGAIDNSPDGEGKSPQGGKLVNYVDAALDDVAAGRPVKAAVTRPYGCTVKYGS